MIFYIAIGLAGFVALKSFGVISKASVGTTIPQTTPNPKSAQVKTNPSTVAGLNNQPWYSGPAVTGTVGAVGAAALATGVGALSGLFSSGPTLTPANISADIVDGASTTMADNGDDSSGDDDNFGTMDGSSEYIA